MLPPTPTFPAQLHYYDPVSRLHKVVPEAGLFTYSRLAFSAGGSLVGMVDGSKNLYLISTDDATSTYLGRLDMAGLANWNGGDLAFTIAATGDSNLVAAAGSSLFAFPASENGNDAVAVNGNAGEHVCELGVGPLTGVTVADTSSNILAVTTADAMYSVNLFDCSMTLESTGISPTISAVTSDLYTLIDLALTGSVSDTNPAWGEVVVFSFDVTNPSDSAFAFASVSIEADAAIGIIDVSVDGVSDDYSTRTL